MVGTAGFLDLAHVSLVRGNNAVLHDVNLTIRNGEQVALLGPNGCGKSTLLKVISCELRPLANAATRVRVLGRERWDLVELKKKLGVVQNEIPGKATLKITGREALLTGFFSSSMLWPHLAVTPQMHMRAAEVSEQLGIKDLGNKLFGEMSAGQQRRILIGRALVASADCLLLDEPSNALDLAAQYGLREMLMLLAESGTTMLYITHHVADLIPAVRRVLLMQRGRIVADGPREELLTERSLGDLFGRRVHLAEHGGFLHAW